MHRIAVVHDMGSAGVLDIADALQGFAVPVFVCPESDLIEQPKDLIQEVGILCDIAGMNLEEAAEHIRVCEPEAIVTFSEYQLERTAQLAERLGLLFHAPDRIESLTRKYTQRGLLNAAGVSSVSTRLVHDEGSARRALAEIGVPAVLKPDRGTGSRSTYPVDSLEELIDICAEVFPAGAEMGSAAEAFVLEQQIPGMPTSWPWGDYVSVESAVHEGEVTHVAVTGKFPLAEPFRETGSFLPADLSESLREEVLDTASRAVRALGVRSGLCHTEIKFSPQGPQVIEVNGRLGGRIHELLHQSTGMNAIELAVRIALGDDTALRGIDLTVYRSIAFLYAKVPDLRAKILREVRGVEQIRKRPEVTRMIVHQAPGDRIDWRTGRLGNIYVCYGSVPTHEELAQLLVDIEEIVQIDCD
ncbi:ATP-grasp domain-containing protein [Streptomyces sp. NPDC008092]|uniref:ATP-grasp domain-containing protein n=1 Tax=Streptomyces sp. NPDC008092 TaxID=3364808 RepID=UPI0036EBC7C2